MSRAKINRVKISLPDIEQSMQYKFLETAASKKEVEKIAKKRGLVVPSPDISLFKGIYTKADVVNANGSRLSKKIITESLDTLVLKPITHNHEEKQIIGVWLDAKLEKNGDVIAYGAIYKDNFSAEYNRFKLDFEKGTIGISYEIYGDQILNDDGTYDWENVFFCGGALLDRGVRPAVYGSKVLEFAKVKDVGTDTQMTVCDSCEFKFDASTVKPEENGGIKCPSCKNIIGMSKTEESSQIPCKCPSCGNNSWNNIRDKGSDKLIAKCTMCENQYIFEIEEYDKDLPKLGINLALEGKAPCPACDYTIKYPIWANKEKTPLTCGNCGLRFIHKRKQRDIKIIVKSIMEYKEEIMADDKKIQQDEKLEKSTAKAEEELANKEIALEIRKKGIRKLALEIMNYKEDLKILADYEKELATSKENFSKEYASLKENHKKEIASIKKEYKEIAKTIYKRRSELDKFGKDLTDEQVLDDKEFEIAKLKKENAELQEKKDKEIAKKKKEKQDSEQLAMGTDDKVEDDLEEKEQDEYNERLQKAYAKEMEERKKYNK